MCVQAHGDRDFAPNLLVLVTDGKSNNKAETLKQAAELHKTNTNVFAVGVGSGVDMQEINAIATDPKNVFTVTNFDALDSLQASLKKTACEGMKLLSLCLLITKIFAFGVFIFCNFVASLW